VLSLVVRGATVVDGTGGLPFVADLGIDADRIAVVARDRNALAGADAPTLDGTGLTLAPGFVDVHNHADLSPLVHPDMTSMLRQGVTSAVVGNCGMSAWPLSGWGSALELAFSERDSLPAPGWQSFGDYLDAVDTARPAVNVAALVGHGSIRAQVLGDDRRAPDAAELDRMRSLAREAVASGAVGLSTGLIYPPGSFAQTDEIVEVARGAAQSGGLYASHIRGEARGLFDAVHEAVRIGREAGLPAHVSHLKCESAFAWGRSQELLELVHDSGVTADQYPYTAWNSTLDSLLPPWAPVRELEQITADPDARHALRTAVEEGEAGFESGVAGVGWESIVIEGTADTSARGRSVAAIAEQWGCEPIDAMVRLLLADPSSSCIGHAMTDDDVATILADPRVFVASDGSAAAPDGPGGALPVHPRNYATFPRALALSRQQGLLPLEQVVRTMTSLPADRFGLTDRGRISEGAFADLVLFDSETVADVSTFESPHAFSSGIAAVIVNGQLAWRATGEVGGTAISRHGRALRHR
jgi:N-acyl-D-aspartate/D-glutamate deacylase